MVVLRSGNAPRMEETPICASVERDLQLSVDELTASVGTGPVPGPASLPTPGPADAPA